MERPGGARAFLSLAVARRLWLPCFFWVLTAAGWDPRQPMQRERGRARSGSDTPERATGERGRESGREGERGSSIHPPIHPPSMGSLGWAELSGHEGLLGALHHHHHHDAPPRRRRLPARGEPADYSTLSLHGRRARNGSGAVEPWGIPRPLLWLHAHPPPRRSTTDTLLRPRRQRTGTARRATETRLDYRSLPGI